LGKLFLSDREVLLSPHAEDRIATRGVTHIQVKETLQEPDSTTGNPEHPNGFNYSKTFGDMRIRVSTTVDSGMEIVVTVCVY